MSSLLKVADGLFNKLNQKPIQYIDDLFNVFTYTGTNNLKTIDNKISLSIEPITNTVSSNSSVSLSPGLTNISLTSKGQDNILVSLGQAYIAPTGNASYPSGLPPYSPGQVYIAPTGNASYPTGLPAYIAPSGYVSGTAGSYAWNITPGGDYVYTIHKDGSIISFSGTFNPPPTATNSGQYYEYFTFVSNEFYQYDDGVNPGLQTGERRTYRLQVCNSYTVTAPTDGYYTNAGQGLASYPSGLPPYSPGQVYIAPTGNASYPSGLPVYNAGQVYIAPSYSAGANSTVTIDGITHTWLGAPADSMPVSAIPSTKIINITDTTQILSYNIVSGSTLFYSYNIPTTTLGGGLVLIKNRSSTNDYMLYDTVRGINKSLSINNNLAQKTLANSLTSFNQSGFSLGNDANVNALNLEFVSYSFNRSQSFVDIIEYIGDGTFDRIVNHGLGVKPGMISVKAEESTGDWITRHKDAAGEFYLNQTAGQSNVFNHITDFTKDAFIVKNDANILNVKYITYLFANDVSVNSLIKCGSYISGNQAVNNTLTSSGSLTIPDGVTNITITGKGANGTSTYHPEVLAKPGVAYSPGQPYIAPTYGDNSWYNPGQPYIAAVTGQPYIAPVTNYWWTPRPEVVTYSGPINPGLTTGYYIPPLTAVPTALGQTFYIYYQDGPDSNGNYQSKYAILDSFVSGVTPGQPYIASVTGQPYIAPSSGGGVYLISSGQPYIAPTQYVAATQYAAAYTSTTIGEESTFTINNFTYVFDGGNGVLSEPTTENIVIPNSNQTADFVIPVGGSINLSYNINNSFNKITLGFRPQFILIKKLNSDGNLVLLDTTRGLPFDAPGAVLNGNSNAAETQSTYVKIMADGFSINSAHTDVGNIGDTYCYVAVRERNKLPKISSEIYNSILKTGNGAVSNIFGNTFSPDLVISKNKAGGHTEFTDRLRGRGLVLYGDSNIKEQIASATSDITNFTMDGIASGTPLVTSINTNNVVSIINLFKCAPSVLDYVCYDYDIVKHSLGVIPELILSKSRSSDEDWIIYHKDLTNQFAITLNSDLGKVPNTFYNGLPDNQLFKVNLAPVGYLSSIVVTNSGSNYVTPPVVIINGIASGVSTSAIAVLDAPYNAGQEAVIQQGNASYPTGLAPYSPGQAYIAPYTTYTPSYTWVWSSSNFISVTTPAQYSIGSPSAPSYQPSSGSETASVYWSEATAYPNEGTNWVTTYTSQEGTSTPVYNPGQPYIAPIGNASYPSGLVPYVEGQPYIAPSGGHVISVTITNVGEGFITAPIISFSAGDTTAISLLGTGVTNKYISYLFATLAGISKVFSYTGNGTILEIDCGFSTGARFVILKRADGVGDWFNWDTSRGIVAGNDPHLSLNNTIGEVTIDDSIDPSSSGFIVNQNTTTNINLLNVFYIGFSIA